MIDCIVASTTGALKGINLRDNVFNNLMPIKSLNPKKDEVTSMIWNDDDQTSVLAAQMDRQLRIFDTEQSSYSTLFEIEGGTGPVRGLHITKNDRIVSCVESGVAVVWSRDGTKYTTLTVGESVTAMRGSLDSNAIVTGGKGNLVKTWDLETGKQTWGAKNVPPDFLLIEQPIMVTDVLPIPEQNVIVEATKLHELRLYDPRAMRRPVNRMPFMDVPITAIAVCRDKNRVVAANSIGEMGLFDIRGKVHPIRKFKGQAGAIRSISTHPTEPYIATCGIDRFVRVHDLDSKKLIHKIYCKTRMNKILLRSDLSIMKKEKEETDKMWADIKEEDESDMDASSTGDSDDSSDEVWNAIDAPKEEKNQRKRKESEAEEMPKTLKKKKIDKGRKREEVKEEITLSDGEEPAKKSRQDVDDDDEVTIIKEEVASDNEDEPPKKKKRSSKKKTTKV